MENWFFIFIQQESHERVEGNLCAREWYLALNNRGDRHFHSDYEFLRDKGSPFFLVSLLSDAFQETTGNCARLFTLRAKSLSPRLPRTKEPVLKDVLRRPVATSQSTRNYWDSCCRCRMRAPTAKDALDLKWPLWNSRFSTVVRRRKRLVRPFWTKLVSSTEFRGKEKGERRDPHFIKDSLIRNENFRLIIWNSIRKFFSFNYDYIIVLITWNLIL